MKALIATAICLGSVVLADEKPSLWMDTGKIEMLDLAGGPAGAANSPQPPFTFVKEEQRGTAPKIVVEDGRKRKWMVKFGDEAKAETFASRIAWAAGYPVRACYYLASGQIRDVQALKRAGKFIDNSGAFRDARFQMFDDESFHAVSGGKLDLTDHKLDRQQLNGLKLALLLVANWDVKLANTAVFETDGHRYATVSDWGASLGDPGAADPRARKWNCAGFSTRTKYFIDGVANGYVDFNYEQYAGKHIETLTQGIRVEDVRWFLSRMSHLSDNQLRAGLQASGANEEETTCFATAIRKRLQALESAANARTTTR